MTVDVVHLENRLEGIERALREALEYARRQRCMDMRFSRFWQRTQPSPWDELIRVLEVINSPHHTTNVCVEKLEKKLNEAALA